MAQVDGPMIESAALLREAAARMRDLAEKATSGPWLDEVSRDGRWFVEPVAVMLADPDDPDTFYEAESDAAFIASMHPGVARAVADLLSEIAAIHRPAGNPGKEPWGCSECYPHDGHWPCATYASAEDTARAFLGPDR